ncbi:limonene-1,2-epoxide hydrolase family protein [Phenylobacterium sp.]|uniref:limonene-1,2-epoxide hydrolase family protein n=1 Tax=Phenylobacterium sp. TaxID=1871053 RepID=UPI00271C40BF|nr:limonene-1,2-epoxide hydrolase family protein [Phenylobacterium sp.]MDO8378809.1 limonene-1,2-epoxide hydrolase family protein [Phenylobacterium sp.]
MSAASMSPLEIVRQFMTLMEPLNYDAALKLVSGDCEYVNPPPIGAVRGPAGIRAVLEPFFGPTSENEFRVLREAAFGPVVFLERLDRHLFGDRWVELPVTGVYEVHDGVITYWRDYFDAPTIMSQLPAR